MERTRQTQQGDALRHLSRILIVPCIKAGTKEGGIVLDPFMGSGTTGIVARKLNRNYVGIELNPEYQQMAERRIFDNGENLFNQ